MRKLKYTTTDNTVFDNLEEAEQHQTNLDEDLIHELELVVLKRLEDFDEVSNTQLIGASRDLAEYMFFNLVAGK